MKHVIVDAWSFYFFNVIIGFFVVRLILGQHLNYSHLINIDSNPDNFSVSDDDDHTASNQTENISIEKTNNNGGLNSSLKISSRRINSDTSNSSNDSCLTQSDVSLNSSCLKSEKDMTRPYMSQISPEYINRRRESTEVSQYTKTCSIPLRSITPIPKHIISQSYEEIERSATPYIPGGPRQKCVSLTRRGGQCRNAALLGTELCRVHSFTY